MILRRDSGFTIIELLLVISIIGLLVALLMPALSYSREAARNTQCRNNLRQIGIALQQYHGVHKAFPGYAGEDIPAGVNFPGLDSSRRGGGRIRGSRGRGGGPAIDRMFQDGTWIVQSMAFMEETQLRELLVRIGIARNNRDELMRQAVRTPVPSFHCPSRRTAIAYPLHGAYRSRYGQSGARTDYAMNAGNSRSPGRMASIGETGVWVPGHRVRGEHITDGLSKTYLVGEKAMEADLYTTGRDRGDLSPIAGWTDHFGAANSYVRFAARAPAPDRTENCLACHDFGSAHPVSWNVLLCDGSVHSMPYDMDLDVHLGFASTQGGEEVEYD